MITKDPANKVTGEVFEDFTPVAYLIVKQEDLQDWVKNNPGLEFYIEEIKPIRPDFKEIKINPRSRSSKLRAAIKT